MKRDLIIAFLLIVLLVAGCSKPQPPSTPAATEVEPSADAPPQKTSPVQMQTPDASEPGSQAAPTEYPQAPPPDAFEGLALPLEQDEYFSGSGACAICS